MRGYGGGMATSSYSPALASIALAFAFHRVRGMLGRGPGLRGHCVAFLGQCRGMVMARLGGLDRKWCICYAMVYRRRRSV